MSGICGLMALNGQTVGRDGIAGMLEDMRAWGGHPHIWPSGPASGPAALGARVSIFTPEDEYERQPLASADGSLTLVADCRLDNREALAAAFRMSASELERMPDSALILCAYQMWGDDCTRHLLGDFAFLIWDANRRAMIGARDHVGQRVLFYHIGAGHFSVASKAAALLRLSHIPARLDEQSIADFLYLLQDPEATFFEGIRRLPAGHLMVMSETGLRLHRYWTPLDVRHVTLGSDQEYREAFRAVFDEAVRARLRGGPVGVMMSAGLDSASVGAVAAVELRKRGERLTALHAAPRAGFSGPVRPGWIADESADVQAIADLHDNLDLTVHRTNGTSPFQNLEALFETFGTPIRNPNNLGWLDALFATARAKGIRTLLTGSKGNATISSGGLRFLREMARQGQWGTTAREVRMVAREQGVPARHVLKEHVIIPLTPAPMLRAYARLRGRGRSLAESAASFSAINPDFAAKLQMAERKHALVADARRNDEGSALHQRMRLLLGAADGGDIWQGYRARFGVEPRDPTCDVRVVEFCFGIPGTLFMREGQGRWLVRHSMRDVLPASVLDRRTRGAQSADWMEWLPGMRRELTEELVRLDHSDVAQRCLDVPRLRKLLTDWPAQFGIEHLEDYALVLLRAMETGRFIRWFEESYA